MKVIEQMTVYDLIGFIGGMIMTHCDHLGVPLEAVRAGRVVDAGRVMDGPGNLWVSQLVGSIMWVFV